MAQLHTKCICSCANLCHLLMQSRIAFEEFVMFTKVYRIFKFVKLGTFNLSSLALLIYEASQFRKKFNYLKKIPYMQDLGGISTVTCSEFMGKRFQAAQPTHERCLTIDHSCKISDKLIFHQPLVCMQYYMLRILLHTRGRWKISLVDMKKIFCRSDRW